MDAPTSLRLAEFSSISATAPRFRPVDPGMEGKLPAEIPFLRVFLRRLAVGCPALEVDDLQQQTMHRALQFQDRYDPSRPLRPWLHTIAFRVFLDARAAALRGPVLLQEDPRQSGVRGGALPTQEEVDALLHKLPPPQGEILRRFHLLEQSIASIAYSLQLPEGTVKSHLHRARFGLAREARAEDWL